jgi:endo-alpha-1,4-polygalactosaminidase (GH114 family)
MEYQHEKNPEPEFEDIPFVDHNAEALQTTKSVLEADLQTTKSVLEADLQTTKEDLQSKATLEDLQTVKTQLQTTNEQNQKLEARIAFLETALISR